MVRRRPLMRISVGETKSKYSSICMGLVLFCSIWAQIADKRNLMTAVSIPRMVSHLNPGFLALGLVVDEDIKLGRLREATDGG